MQTLEEKYCIIREYKSEFTTTELLKRLIHIHRNNNEIIINKGCSDHEVENEKK